MQIIKKKDSPEQPKKVGLLKRINFRLIFQMIRKMDRAFFRDFFKALYKDMLAGYKRCWRGEVMFWQAFTIFVVLPSFIVGLLLLVIQFFYIKIVVWFAIPWTLDFLIRFLATIIGLLINGVVYIFSGIILWRCSKNARRQRFIKWDIPLMTYFARVMIIVSAIACFLAILSTFFITLRPFFA